MSEAYNINNPNFDDIVMVSITDKLTCNGLSNSTHSSITPYNTYNSGGIIQDISSSGTCEYTVKSLNTGIDNFNKTVKDDTLTTLDDNFNLRLYKNGHQIDATKFLPQVADVQTYGDKVVKVTFSDGSFTKAVKDDEDDFLTAGIAICYLKKMLAADAKYSTNAFNKVLTKILKVMDKNRRAAEKKKKDEAEAKAKRLAKEVKKNKKKAKRDKRK